MSAQTHYTEQLIRRIRQLEAEYEEQEKLKECAHRALVEKLEAAQSRILELESHCGTKEQLVESCELNVVPGIGK